MKHPSVRQEDISASSATFNHCTPHTKPKNARRITSTYFAIWTGLLEYPRGRKQAVFRYEYNRCNRKPRDITVRNAAPVNHNALR